MIYVVTDRADMRRVKIGFGRDALRRVAELNASRLQCVSDIRPLVVVAIAEGDLADEQEFHSRFSWYRVEGHRGEWYRMTPAIVRVVERLKTGSTLRETMASLAVSQDYSVRRAYGRSASRAAARVVQTTDYEEAALASTKLNAWIEAGQCA